jgi:para-aminobenzoate synthetase component 2
VILVIDNYDSFTFNLVQALEAAGADLLVARNDRIDRAAIERLADGGGPRARRPMPGSEPPMAEPGRLADAESDRAVPEPGRLADAESDRPLRAILVSPGPGNPATAGVSIDAIRVAAARGIPMLGVCLGLQCLGAAYGASIVRAPSLVHGEASEVEHEGTGLLAGLPSPFEAGRYHSLCVDPATVPPGFDVTGRTRDGVVMAMRHRHLPLEGVQFHPESVLTPDGPLLLANFLRVAGEGDPGVLAARTGSFATRGLAAATGSGRGPARRDSTAVPHTATRAAEVTAR